MVQKIFWKLSRNNQEVENDEDEIGLHDHVYDTSEETERKKRRKNKRKSKFPSKQKNCKEENSESNLSNIDEVENEEDIQNHSKKRYSNEKALSERK